MKLELKHIVPYPDLCIQSNHSGKELRIAELLGIDKVNGVHIGDKNQDYWTSINFIKPILYPLDLTKPIWFEGKEIIPIEELKLFIDVDREFVEGSIDYTEYGVVQLLIKWKIDVFGLIPKDLAISVHDVDPVIYK